MSRIINQNTEPLFIFDMPDDETLSETISVKGEKGERGDPTKLSDLENDEGFITVNTDELANYYTKTATDNLLNTKLDKSTFNALEMPTDFFTGDETVSDSGSSIMLANTSNTILKSVVIRGDTEQSSTPTPETPVDIKTVTGLQAIAITGDDAQAYALDLGGLELCKLSTFQDYIYKNGGKWFLHKAVDHATVSSLSDGTSSSINTSSTNTTRVLISNCLNGQASYAQRALAIANNFAYGSVWNSDTVGFSTNTGSDESQNSIFFRVAKETIGTDTADVESWLNANPIEVYYVLASASDSEITDAAIINQLEAIAKARSCNGTTVIDTSGDLPALLDVVAFTSGWGGTVNGLLNEIDNVSKEVDDIKTGGVYVFPSRWGADSTSGNSNLVIVDGKTMLFDTNQSSRYSDLKAMLAENNIIHLDYVFISHFDADHYGNFINLVNDGFIDSDTKYYHGLFSSVFYQSSTAYDQIEALCEQQGITSTVPTDLSTITDGNITLKFGNTNLGYAEAHYTNANQASMVVLLTHKNISSLFMGDAILAAQEYLYANNFVDRQIDLYCVAHHAIERPCSVEFIKSVSPRIAFAQTQFQDYRKNKLSRNRETALLNELGADVYYSFAHSVNPRFIEVGGSLKCVNAAPDNYVGLNNDAVSYYVDASTTNTVQDGSSDYPFIDLPQAIGKIGLTRNRPIIIHLAAGTYGTLNTVDMLKNKAPAFYSASLTIIGNSKDDTFLNQGVDALDCNLVLRDLTINVCDSDARALHASFSKVTVRDCAITNSRGTASAIGCYLENNSDIVFLNVSISDVATGIEQHGGTCAIQNLSANTVASLLTLSSTSTVEIQTLGTLTSVTKIFNDDNGIVNVKPASQAISMASSTGTITLDQSNKLYNKLLLTYQIRRGNTNYGTAYKLINYVSGSGITISEFNLHASDTVPIIYGASATMTLADGSINITRNGSYTQTASETSFYAGSSSSAADGIRITNVQYLRS